jgi:hypothetical protein
MNMKRMRGRNHRPNSGGGGGGFRNQQNGIPLNRNHVFDSTGPEMRVRGTAQQLYDKYQQLARDAFSNGDRVTGEAYYQHAEHYFRIISAINQAQGQPNGQANQQNGQPYQGNGQDRGNYNNNGGDRGNYNSDRGDYSRREQNFGDVSTEPQETRPERPQETRSYEPRPQQEPRRFEPRQHNNDQRSNEPRNNEHRNNRQDFQRQDRAERYRPVEAPAVDPRIDISSALEAELAATVAEPQLPGFGEQPVVEARSIPIIPDAPPAAAAEEPSAPVRTPRPRGRPRAVKPEAEKAASED